MPKTIALLLPQQTFNQVSFLLQSVNYTTGLTAIMLEN